MTNKVTSDIIYTKVDEAPQLASVSLLPVIQSFAKAAGVSVGVKDISLAGRIIAAFPENLTEDQRQPDDLAEFALYGEKFRQSDLEIEFFNTMGSGHNRWTQHFNL